MNDDELRATFISASNAERRRLQAGRNPDAIEFKEWLEIHPAAQKAAIRAVRDRALEEAAQAVLDVENAFVTSDWGTVVPKYDARDAIRALKGDS